MSKKAVSLSLETVVIAILVLIALFLIAFFIIRYGGQLGAGLRDQANASVSLLPNVSAP